MARPPLAKNTKPKQHRPFDAIPYVGLLLVPPNASKTFRFRFCAEWRTNVEAIVWSSILSKLLEQQLKLWLSKSNAFVVNEPIQKNVQIKITRHSFASGGLCNGRECVRNYKGIERHDNRLILCAKYFTSPTKAQEKFNNCPHLLSRWKFSWKYEWRNNDDGDNNNCGERNSDRPHNTPIKCSISVRANSNETTTAFRGHVKWPE